MKIGKDKDDPDNDEPVVGVTDDVNDPETVFKVNPKPDKASECIQLESNENPGKFVSVKPDEGILIGGGDDTCDINGYEPNKNPLIEPGKFHFSRDIFF